jgi:hypothetical protein
MSDNLAQLLCDGDNPNRDRQRDYFDTDDLIVWRHYHPELDDQP